MLYSELLWNVILPLSTSIQGPAGTDMPSLCGRELRRLERDFLWESGANPVTGSAPETKDVMLEDNPAIRFLSKDDKLHGLLSVFVALK
jgi:hypothetical protein